MTEYKALHWGSINVGELNDLFEEGWEYVDGFSQSLSVTSSSYHKDTGEILIILKRNKASL